MFFVISVLLAQTIVGCVGIAAPFSDGRLHWNWGPPFWLLRAAQNAAVGMIGARFGVVSAVTVRDGVSTAAGFYQSHPQLIGPVVVLWAQVFGTAEWSIRALALALTVATGAVLWLAVRRLFSVRIAHATLVFWTFMPIIAVYGRKLDQEQLVLFFLALALLGYARVRQTIVRPLLFAGALLGACLSDWSGFVFAACFAATFFLFGTKEDRRFVVASGVAIGSGLLLIAAQLAAQWTVTHEAINFVSLYQFRSVSHAPSVGSWLLRQGRYGIDNLSPLGVLLVPLLGWCVWSRKEKTGKVDMAAAVCGAVLVGQVLYLIVVPQAAEIHGYFQYYMSLPFAVFLACALDDLRERRGRVVMGVVGLLFVSTLLIGVTRLWAQVQHTWYGDATDVALLRQVREYPHAMRIEALGGPVGWFDNPNIEYYAGRGIATVTPGAVPLPDVYIVGKNYTDGLVERLQHSTMAPLPTPRIRSCSAHFCLVETWHGEYN